MSGILRWEIDRLVLGYLRETNSTKASKYFCKSSPHLQGEYEFAKRGIEPVKIVPDTKTLVGVLKEYTEIQHIVTNYINAQQNAASLPAFETFKDKIEYICRIPLQQPLPSKESKNRRKVTLKRRRSSLTAGTDEDDSSPATATQIEDMPGHSQFAAKRRKMFDENLVITKGPYAAPQSLSSTSDEESDTVGEASKSPQESADATRPSTSHLASAKKRDFDAFTTNRPSTNFEQTSAMTADATVPFEIFSEAILENQEFQNLLVENINTSGIVDRVHSNDGTDRTLEQQLEQAMENIIQTTQANPIFEDIVREAVEQHSWPADDEQMSSSTPNKSSEPETVIDEMVVAQSAIGPSESIKQRLRPRKTPATELTASTTKKRKSGKKIEVLSEVRAYPNQQLPALIQTQENQFPSLEQQQLQQQPSTLFYLFVDQSGTPCIAPFMTECEQPQPMAVNNNLNFPTLLDGTVCIPSIISSSTTSSLDPGTILNMTDPQNAVVVHDGSQAQNLSNEEPSSSCLEENRIIVIDGTEVNAEALKASAPHNQINPIPTLAQFAEEHAPKSGTPKQPIQPNVPCTSRSSTTPRHKISHVRVLDFTTPARSKLIDPTTATYTGGLDVLNSSRIAANETPLNRTIVSAFPNSAPPKIDSTKSEHVISSILHAETSSSMDTASHVDVDEDTVISVGSETPKVRKKCRKACVRTLSSHKEVNAEVAAKRLKRLASTKKKIVPNEDGADGGDEESQPNAFKVISEEKSKETETQESTTDSALREWKLNLAARKDPALFENLLREENSKLQAKKDSANGSKRRQNRNARSKRKAAAAATTLKSKSTTTIDKAEDVVTAGPNESLNSSVENACNESNTSLQAHAEMLENNLKSAKKVTPEKKVVAAKTKPKRNKNEIYIKLPESPKVKALKRHKSATKVKPSTSEVSSTTEQPTEPSVQEEVSAPTLPPSPVPSQPKSEEPIARANTSDDLQVAQDLLQLNETIIQHEKQLSARKVADTRSDCTSTVTTATISDTIVRIPLANTEIVQRNTEMSLSALLETPMKVDAFAMFPKTPGIQLPPQLVTPMLKTVNPMEDSIMKNHEFPTPDFPITPGAILTPRREIGTSPRSDHELIYGAANRPTDYSSSSSYYKPDESDGVDKQLQAMLRVSRQSSNVQSADEIEMVEESAELPVPIEQNVSENVSNERLNYSGSSSSSSSSSDSDSDSDSSDSSSHSSGSNRTQKSVHKTSEPTESISVDVPETSVAVVPLPEADLVMTIKSHIESTAATVITQSTLLPEPEPVIDKAAEQTALLDEKRLRLKQAFSQDDSAKPSTRPVSKAAGSKKAREDAKARLEALRGPQKVLSPSKRKSTNPRRCINNAANDAAKPSASRVAETKSSELIKANEVVSNVPAPTPPCPLGDEESIDAIKKHLASETKTVTKESPLPPPPVVPSSDLIEILEDKCNALTKRSPSVKTTKQIEPLPLRKVSTRSTKTNEIKNAASSTTKTKAQLKLKCKSTEAKKPAAVASKSSKPDDSQEKLPSIESSMKDRAASPVPETPVKERRARQMYNIFGEISDIETPVKKSPVKSHSFAEPNSVPGAENASPEITAKEQSPVKVVPAPPSPKKEPLPSKENLVSSTTSSDQTESRMDEPKLIERTETIGSDDSSSESDDDDGSDDDLFNMEICTPTHLVHVISNSESIINTPMVCPPFRSIKLVMPTATVHLAVTAEEELYDSAPQQDSKAQPVVEAPSSTFGKPLLTSTPSSQKSKGTGINPKFNLKHKDHTPSSMQGDEYAEAKAATPNFNKNKKDLEINRKDLNVNKILGYLHPY